MKWTLAILFLFLFTAPATADMVVLKNGDQLTGEVLSMTEGALKFKSEYVGEVTIQWENVEKLFFEKSVPIHLTDGQMIRGKMVLDEKGNLKLQSDELGSMDVDVSSVTSINPPPPAVKEPWSGNVKLLSSVTKGNTDTFNLGFSAEAIYEKEVDKLRFYTSTDYEETEHNETVRNVKGGFQFNHTFYDDLYGFALLDLEYDKFKDLDLRTKVGGGIGHKFINNDRHKLSGEFGLLWVEEDYDKGKDDAYAALRFAEEFDWKISEKCSFIQRLEYIPSLEHFSDYLLNFTAAFRTNLTDSLFWEIGAEDSYNSDPTTGVDRNDFKGYTSLGFNF